MSKETWVGVAWAVGILIAMGGIFWYEAATFELNEYYVDYDEETTLVEEFTGTLAEGESESFAVLLTEEIRANLTAIVVLLEWTDGDASPDTFTLLVNGNETLEDSGSDESISLEHPYLSLPDGKTVEAVDRDDARRFYVRESAHAAAGTINVTVTLDNAPGTLPEGVPLPQTNTDGANDFTLTVSRVNFYAQLE